MLTETINKIPKALRYVRMVGLANVSSGRIATNAIVPAKIPKKLAMAILE